MSLYDKASLVLIPSGTKAGKVFSQKPTSGDGDFDFTRSSYATRVNSQGLIEKERSNLLLQSNNFDTTWGVFDLNSPTNGFAGYDGSNDAWLLQENTDNDEHYIRQSSGITSGIGTFSFFAKKKDYDFIQFARSGDGSEFANFNINNGTIGNYSGSLIDVNIESKGNGWHRCSVTYSFNTNAFVGIALIRSDVSSRYDTYLGNGTNGTYIQDAQLEQGLVATDVIETTTSVVYEGITDNVPRLDYDGDCPSLLLEPQRQNLVTQSEYIGATEWVNASPTRNITITETSNTNPEGRAICWKIQGLSTNNQLAYVDSTTIGTTLTNSIYVKRVSGTGDVRLRDVNNFHTDFSLSVADGWKRIDVTATATSTVARFYLNLTTHNDEILVWGAQQEEGSFATSYIPTYGTSVTRTGDVCDNAGDSTIFNNDEGVLYFEAKTDNEDVVSIAISNGLSSNRLTARFRPDISKVQLVVVGTTDNFSFNSATMSLSEYNKVAIVYNNGQYYFFVNGVKSTIKNGGTFDSNDFTELEFNRGGGVEPFYGDLKVLAYFNRALTDTELADLTT